MFSDSAPALPPLWEQSNLVFGLTFCSHLSQFCGFRVTSLSDRKFRYVGWLLPVTGYQKLWESQNLAAGGQSKGKGQIFLAEVTSAIFQITSHKQLPVL